MQRGFSPSRIHDEVITSALWDQTPENKYNEEYLRNPRQFYITSLMCSASYWGKLIAGASGKGIFLQSLLTAQLKD